MSEPKVEFFLDNIESELVKTQFDQLREWHEFRENVRTPAVRTFNGTQDPGDEINLYVPGYVYGYSGMTCLSASRIWVPMTFDFTTQIGQCYFAFETTNTEGNFVKVRNHTTSTGASDYRVTLMYRDA